MSTRTLPSLAGVADRAGLDWLDETCSRAAHDPGVLVTAFAAAGRRVGRGPAEPAAEVGDPHAWTVDDVARAQLLLAVGSGDGLVDLLQLLYSRGDAAERRGVLRALDVLPLRDEGLPIVRDALRTNDARLVASALGPYARAHLAQPEFEQAVLKCLFIGVPLDSEHLPARRRTENLARMVAELVRERVAAGRDIPSDVWLVLDEYPGAIVRAGLHDELRSPVHARRGAAERALAGHEHLLER